MGAKLNPDDYTHPPLKGGYFVLAFWFTLEGLIVLDQNLTGKISGPKMDSFSSAPTSPGILV